jgi:ferritin
MAQQTSYTITAYNRVTQTFTTLAHILAEDSQDAKEKFIKDYYWRQTNENVSIIVQSPVCR